MSRNGSGTYSLPAGNPVVTGTTISSTWANNTLTDIGNALTASIANDGQTPITANLPMSTFRHTGVGNAAARTDYAAAGQVADSSLVWGSTAAGTVDVITFNVTPAITAYAAGQRFEFISSGANTGAVTVNVNSVGAKSLTKNGTTALAAGDIPSGGVVEMVYDGTQFQITKIKQGTASGIDVPVVVANGGTGKTSLTAYAVLCGGTTATGVVQSIASVGTTGQILTSNGAGALPTFQNFTATNTQTFTSSGTWNKPSGFSATARVYIQAWGGGGSGGTGSSGSNAGGGGGGGAYKERWVTLSDLGSTETVTIGAGGTAVSSGATAGNAGGNTTFGSLVTAYGGGGGASGNGGGGGGGGGSSAGASTNTTTGGTGGNPAGAAGGTTTAAGTSASGYNGAGGAGNKAAGGSAAYGGGGGGGGTDGSGVANQLDGGTSIFGGGGGGGGADNGTPGAGGASQFGGNGGGGAINANNATAGTQPSGGGGGAEAGNSGAGGAGRVIVTTIA